MKKIYYIITFLILNSLALKAEVDSIGNNKYGLFGSLQIHQFIASFKKLPDVATCCPNYNNGSGQGFDFGLLYELPLPLGLHIGLKVGLANYNGHFYSYENTKVKVDSILVDGAFRHDLDVNLNDIFIEPYLKIELLKNFNLIGGGHFGSFITHNFNQKEVLVEPVNRGVFVDTKTRTRNSVSGTIKNTDEVNSNLFFGADYSFPLNNIGSLILVPHFIFKYGTSNVIKDLNWKINSYNIGASVKYTKIDEKKPPIKIFRIEETINVDTLIVESENVLKKEYKKGFPLVFNNFEDHGDTNINYSIIIRKDTIFKRPLPKAELTLNTDRIIINTQFITEGYPVLPVVFFEPMNNELKDDYEKIKEIEKFNVDELDLNPIVFHNNVLNIIGSRLKSDNSQTITLSGYADSVIEKGDCSLALKRAETVKKYLIDIWKIDPKRISIKSKGKFCSPQQGTLALNDSGYRENMRVEIATESKKILSSVLRKKSLQIFQYKPFALEFDPTGSTSTGVKEWYYSLSAGDDLQLLFKNGTGTPEKATREISLEDAYKLKNYKNLDLEFGVVDTEGKVANYKKKIDIVIDTSKYEYQRLSLILFAFNSDKVPDAAQTDLKLFLAKIDSSAKIKISGYTDFLGTDEYNLALSQRRAQNTAIMVKSLAPQIEISDISGFGFNKFPPGIRKYSTPVERFLSRTVQVEISRLRENK